MLECVVNVSEGRRPELVARMEGRAATAGVLRLHSTSDVDHNRSVLTWAGTAPPLERSVVTLCREALQTLDLREHEGRHPRVGLVDVVPFVPLEGSTMDDAISCARRTARAIAEATGIPTFLYGHAASSPERRELAAHRRGGSRGLAERIATTWPPDYGPKELHPRGGATLVGARDVLIAFNVLLDTPDVGLAREIAHRVRARDGGLPGVKALGLLLESRGRAQVSMNLTDYRATGIADAFAAVAREAETLGCAAVEAELIGLAPRAALLGADGSPLRLPGLGRDQVLEEALRTAAP